MRDFEADALAAPLHVEAKELLERGRLDDVEALLAAEGRGLPVAGAADGVREEALHAPGPPDVDHGEGRDGGAGALGQQTCAGEKGEGQSQWHEAKQHIHGQGFLNILELYQHMNIFILNSLKSEK